jgi:hypothetical protein
MRYLFYPILKIAFRRHYDELPIIEPERRLQLQLTSCGPDDPLLQHKGFSTSTLAEMTRVQNVLLRQISYCRSDEGNGTSFIFWGIPILADQDVADLFGLTRLISFYANSATPTEQFCKLEHLVSITGCFVFCVCEFDDRGQLPVRTFHCVPHQHLVAGLCKAGDTVDTLETMANTNAPLTRPIRAIRSMAKRSWRLGWA